MAKAKRQYRLGMKGKIFIGDAGSEGVPTNELANVTDVTITLDAGEADVTTRENDGFRATIGGLKECSIEFSMKYYPGDPNCKKIRDAWLNNTTVHLAALTSATGEGPIGDFAITGFSRSEPLEEAITYDVTAKLSQWEKWQEEATEESGG